MKGPFRTSSGADRQPHLWLRRLPRRVPVEQVRLRDAGNEAAGSRGPEGAGPCRPRRARRGGVQGAVFRLADQADRIWTVPAHVLIAIGNSGDRSFLPQVLGRLHDPVPLIRGAAVWALKRLATDKEISAQALEFLGHERDQSVKAEWNAVVQPARVTASDE